MARVKRNISKKLVKGRERKAHISAINVVLQPHNPDLYVALMRAMYKSEYAVKIRGQSALMVGSCSSITRGKPQFGLTGVFYKFFKLDANEPWFDTETRSVADKEEVSKIVIPENLKPHLQEFSYVFYPKGHRLYFVSRRSGAYLSPKFVLDYFERLVQQEEFSTFGSIKFTIEPEVDAVAKIFSLSRIKSIFLDINKPNPDDLRSAEAKMKARMSAQNISRQQSTFVEATNEGIKPDADTKILIKVAASNGKAVAKGIDAKGAMVEVSTESHPLSEPMSYDSNVQTETTALQSFASELHQQIVQ
ncbi:TPA: DUF4747 family protein [Pseudomonas aeruginosa]|uniref:DUF4747 family protein n=1 Tax=Pseudomonas aeruginosa TaxID=287 RepID=UPI0028FFC4E3|nr:DUF4747 family protein [Pseudomonas aeruginosa]MDU0618875.1 DUF4747 family protein [Pseudomonas aeruginosa]HBP1943292.1 DUF4747 family protein [Pseudomonas aeruginosa]